jgi:hypothetical protein
MTLESEETTPEVVKTEEVPTLAPETPAPETPAPETPAPETPVEAPKVDAKQAIETNAYVPTYKVRPEFKQALLKAIGDLPFNQIAGLVNAIDVDILDHNTLTQIVNAIGQFPYMRVESILKNVGNYVTQVMVD